MGALRRHQGPLHRYDDIWRFRSFERTSETFWIHRGTCCGRSQEDGHQEILDWSFTMATAVTTKNPLKSLLDYGQSVWLDYIRRTLLTSGELKHLIESDGLRGMTSNPAIFEKAIAGSADYESALAELAAKDMSAKSIYEHLAIKDIQDAADALRPVYDESKRRDGYVSLEVSPDLANDTAGTLEEARRLCKWVARENVLIKVPATPAGVPAIETLISEGININVTLLFHIEAYRSVALAYISGLEKYAAKGGDLSKVASVAS